VSLSLVTAPTVEPITLLEAKRHLIVDDADDDDLITALISAAREFCETFTHRAFLTQTWDLQLEGFPWGFEPLWIPKPPLQITPTPPVVTYVDTNGDTQTWSASLYTVDAPQGPYARMGRIVPAYFQIFPVTRRVPVAATVRFLAGYGTTAATVPASIKAAMKLLLGVWYENREGAVLERASADVLPFGVEALLWPFKAF
jgi:uncharacterized phiE125 gp8 family phage protein